MCVCVLTELLRSFRIVRATCGSLIQPSFMWVDRARWAQVWIIVKWSGKGTQYSIVGGWQVMSLVTSSVQRRLFQFDIDGLFYFYFKPSLLSGHVHIVVLRRIIFLLQKSVDSRVLTWGVSPPVMCHLFRKSLFCLPMYKSVQSWLNRTS